MKLIILKNNLKEGLSAVERAISESANLPVLKNVLIKTFNNRIQVSGTNLELAVSTYIPGKIIEEGSITIPLHTLLSITNNSDNERINLESERNVLTFQTDNYKAVIQGLPEDEFPIIPKIENTKNTLQIQSEVLRDGFVKVVSAIQISEVRPELSGVLFDFQVTNIKLVGTDSFRLSEQTIHEHNFSSTFQRGFKIIIPLKTVQEFLRIVKGGTVTVYIDPNQILFKNDDLEIISRLIDGTYPDYEQIIPKGTETEVFVDRASLMNSLKLVSTFSSKINEVKINVKNKKFLEVYSANQYLGENKYLVPVKTNGKEFEVSFNWRYLLDGLKNFQGEEIVLGVNGDTKPSLLKAQNDSLYFYIVMPIKQ